MYGSLMRSRAIFLVGVILMLATGCTKTVYVASTEAPTTDAPGEPGSGFTVNGYKIKPGAYLLGVNLEGANLRGANLEDANLMSANLEGADLEDANLLSAYLVFANLTGANLEGANLTGANLEGANLTGASLVSANLTGADLTGASLVSANLTGADLTGAILTGAILTGAILTGAILDDVPAQTATTSPIDYDNGDIFKHSRVEEACGMVRDLQPPNGNNSDTVLVYLTDLAEAIWEATLQNAQYALPKSKYEEFGTNLKASMKWFNEREQQYMPDSLFYVMEECTSFGW
jgi:hypothetical protein